MTPSPRSRRPSAEVQAARAARTDLDAIIDAKENALRAAMFEVRAWRWGWTIKEFNRLRDALRAADVEAETLVELMGRKKRANAECGKPEESGI